MAFCHLFVLFFTAVVTLANAELSSNAEEIQNVLQQLLASKAGHHVSNEHDHNFHHNHNDHERTNIETINLVFKNNKIAPTDELSKPIRNIGEGSGKLAKVGDMLSKLGVRCGCGDHAGRCGCGSNVGRCGSGPDDIPCLDHDHTHDNVILIKHNPDYSKADGENHHSNKNNKKVPADPTIVKLLDDLENSLLVHSNDNQNSNDLGEHIELLYDKDREDNVKKPDGYLEALLKDLEKPSDDVESYDETHKDHLRCCRNCARKSFYRNRDDNKEYLRCCKKCGNKRYSRTYDKDRRDRSDTKPFTRAKVFQINDDLDAVVLDVSDLNNVFKILNNGNNLDKSNSIRGYARLINAESESKHKKPNYENRLQKIKLKDLYRRNTQSGKPQYGVPFELDVQGLGQVNP